MNASSNLTGTKAGWLLWACVALFALRVIGQLEVAILEPAWLPESGAWHSGFLPYPLLLPMQIAMLMLMAIFAWDPRVRNRRISRVHPRVAAALRKLALFHFFAMAVRLAADILENGWNFWREDAISVVSHWVWVLFVLVCCRGAPTEQQHENEESDEIPHGDVPALAQPLRCGFAAREQV
jgi:hypothetical protein